MRALFAGAFCACLVLNASAQTSAQSARATSIAQRYAAVLQIFNGNLSSTSAKDMADHVLLLGSYYNLDPRLLVAIVGVESGWHPQAQSASGARGLGQLMPATADGLSVEPLDRYENLDGTARYLRRLLNQYRQLGQNARYARAIAGYNAGPDAVRRYGGVPPFAQAYVQRVLGLWHRLQSSLPGVGAAQMVATTVTSRAKQPHKQKKPLATASVADFTRLDTATLGRIAQAAPVSENEQPAAIALRETRSLEAEAVLPQPKKTFGRWLSRAFGGGH